MKYSIVVLSALISIGLYGQAKISFTFDDGSTADRPGYSFEEWNTLLLNKLENANVKAAFFVTGHNKTNKKGNYLLESWDEKGHKIANHTYSHPSFNNKDINVNDFAKEILRNDSIISKYTNYVKLFRFPYLKEGNTQEKVNGIRDFLIEQKYKNGYVTIDASDWYIDSRLVKRLRENVTSDISGYRDFYLNHIWEKAQFYEKLSYELNGRHINHTLLLHHNLVSALFIDDLITMFKEKGWQIISANEAFTDPIFNKVPKYAGESLIYALAKDSGKYEELLRNTPEDSKYEKTKMDKLGL